MGFWQRLFGLSGSNQEPEVSSNLVNDTANAARAGDGAPPRPTGADGMQPKPLLRASWLPLMLGHGVLGPSSSAQYSETCTPIATTFATGCFRSWRRGFAFAVSIWSS